MIEVHKNGDLWWLRSDGKTQVTIEHVQQDMTEIVEVVRLILQERVQQRTVEQIVHVPRTTGRGRNSGSDPDYSQEGISKRIHSEFSETRRLKDLAKKTFRIRYQNGSRVMRCVTLTAPAKTVTRRRS